MHLSCEYVILFTGAYDRPRELSFHQSEIQGKNVSTPAFGPSAHVFISAVAPTLELMGREKEGKSPVASFDWFPQMALFVW